MGNNCSRGLSVACITAICAIVLPSAAYGAELEKFFENMSQRRQALKSLHMVSVRKEFTEGQSPQAKKVEIIEVRDGDSVKRLISSADSTDSKPQEGAAKPSRIYSDGEHEWREIAVQDKVMVIKSPARPVDEFAEVKRLLAAGEARQKPAEKVGAEQCLVLEIVGKQEGKSYKATYWVSERYGLILKHRLTRADGWNREWDTETLKVNERLDESKLQYAAPDGAQVLDLQEMRKNP